VSSVRRFLTNHAVEAAPMATQKFNKHSRKLYRKVCRRCGAVKWVVKENLIGKDGLTRLCHTCGSGKITHRLSKHPLFQIWWGIIRRCNSPKSAPYPWYGARGISVCKEWANDAGRFIVWAEAHGWKPGLHIDRVDNDGNYSPGNCRFVTPKENAQNRRKPSRLK
jgi:hypothetical protein